MYRRGGILKKLIIAVGILVILLIVGGILLFANIDKIIRSGTEQVLTYVFEVDATVGGADLKATQGSITFTNIVIPNPDGYGTPTAIRFGEVTVEADIQSFRGDQPTIRLIRLTDPTIVFEKTVRSSNLQDLIDNAMRLVPEEGEEAPEPEQEPEGAQASIIIQRVEIVSTSVGVAVPFTGDSFNVTLPDLVLEDIGGSNNEPVLPAEALADILVAILTNVRGLAEDVVGNFDELASGVVSDASEMVEGTMGEVGGQVNETVEGVTGRVTEGLGGLLNRRNQDE